MCYNTDTVYFVVFIFSRKKIQLYYILCGISNNAVVNIMLRHKTSWLWLEKDYVLA